MRIGLFSDTYLPDINGVATSVETLRKTLEEHGHDVFVIANHKGLIHLKREGNILRLPGIELKWLYGYAMSSPLQIKAKEEIKMMNLDIIHVHTEFGVGIFARTVAKDLNIPVVTTYHTMYEDYTHYFNEYDIEMVEKMLKSLAGNLSKLAHNNAQVVISPSQKTKETLIGYGLTAPIHVIPTGIDLKRYNLENIDKALSMEYLEQTFYSIDNKIEAAKPNAESVKQILENWKYNDINLIEQIKKYNFKLVYPILLVYGANTLTYESNITKVVNYIKSNYSDYKCSLDIPYSIFFILLPVHEVKEIKKEVLKWIEEKKQVLL